MHVADKSAPGLASPYDALVELGDGTLCKISDLFSKTSPVWASLEAEFEKRDPIGNLANLVCLQSSTVLVYMHAGSGVSCRVFAAPCALTAATAAGRKMVGLLVEAPLWVCMHTAETYQGQKHGVRFA